MRPGLRNRVVLAYGLLALGLSAGLAVVTWTVVSHYLVDQRLSSASIETSDNASVLSDELSTSSDVAKSLARLPSTDSSASILYFHGGRYSAPVTAVVPADLVAAARSGAPVERRLGVDGQQVLAVGVPIIGSGNAYFELHPLGELNKTLHTLAIALVAAAAVAAALGLAVGRVASGVALRPLAALTRAAAEVARGQPGVRLDADRDPDLGGLSRSFNRTAAALEHRVAADARFAGDISHELRNPLTAMLNSMQVIQHRRAEVPLAVRAPVDLLATDLERFRRLVLDLLEISRDDGGDGGERETVLIADLIRAAADAAAGRAVTVVAPEAAGLTMQADKRRLERVVTNLVQNAESHGGGCCAVHVSARPGAAVVHVDDAGPGVPPDSRDRIFERFGRTPSRRSAGVGLGLAIVNRHVTWHGGTVSVSDRPGGGARFTLTLPTA